MGQQPSQSPWTGAIIPAYREEAFIGAVVQGLRKQVGPVVVVDDGSPDGTASAAERAGALVLRHERNRGKGAAIQTGLNFLAGTGVERFFLLDGDGQHDPGDIRLFFDAADRTGADLIVGNRMNDLSGMPLIRRWTNQFMSWQISSVCGQKLPDSQCGYRLVRRELIPLLMRCSTGFDFETETLLLACREGHRVCFVPIRTIYRDETSKIRPVRDTIRYFKLMARYRKRPGKA
ncbi:MAG: glycosyltransferase family 2 protein [Verrucomicrobia bacterium]|nr:glycosyltransferase family 2 protein [Verrucomicrobiota bacterium]